MPHALIGYAGSTLRAAEMFHAVFPDDPLYVLVDFFGREVTDTLEVCRHFPELAAAGRLGVRLDTHGGRFLEGWTSRPPMPCSSAMCRRRSAPTGPPRSWAG